MKRQVQPNAATCLITSFAIRYNIPVDDLIKKVGHDGLEKTWDGHPHTSHHSQEIIEVLFKYYSMRVVALDVTPILLDPECSLDELIRYKKLKSIDIDYYLKNYRAVILGIEKGKTFGHAVAWCPVLGIIDPSPLRKLEIENINIEQIFL